MVNVDRRIITAMGMAAVIALTGCAAENDVVSQQTLVETKGATQLLRNEVASRVPTESLLNVEETGDVSEGCGTDPEGDRRYWHSSIEFNINSAYAKDVQDIAEKLITSFGDDGWDATTQTGTNSSTTLMQKKLSKQEMRVSVTGDDNADGLGALIGVDVMGPCVDTAGKDSEEVTRLESSD